MVFYVMITFTSQSVQARAYSLLGDFWQDLCRSTSFLRTQLNYAFELTKPAGFREINRTRLKDFSV